MKMSDDGHVLIGGARWHYPAPKDPTRCAVEGCLRVLTVGVEA